MDDSTFAGLAFPVIRVRFAGPTDSKGSRYIASVHGVRVTQPYDHALSPSDNALLAARKCWNNWYDARGNDYADDRRVFIPGDLSEDAYAFLAVPARFLED